MIRVCFDGGISNRQEHMQAIAAITLGLPCEHAECSMCTGRALHIMGNTSACFVCLLCAVIYRRHRMQHLPHAQLCMQKRSRKQCECGGRAPHLKPENVAAHKLRRAAALLRNGSVAGPRCQHRHRTCISTTQTSGRR